MRFSKFLSLVLCSALLNVLPIAASAQKKDKNNPLAPVLTPATPYSNVRRDNLLNGLQLIMLDRPGELVKCDIVVRGGAMFDLVGKTGLAALTQASLLAANPRLQEEIESLQAKLEYGVNWDTTWFHIETPPANFAPVFEILARLLVVENIRPEAFKRAQAAQLERIKTRRLTPAEQADAAFLKAIYGDHPYGHNIDGEETTVTGIKPGDVYDFFRRFYLANNVSVTIVGPVTQERVMQVFKVYFGGWSKGQIVPATFRQPAQIAQLKLIKIAASDAPNIELRGGVIGVKQSDPDFLVMEVMARILNAQLKSQAADGNFTVRAEPRVLSGPFFFTASVPTDRASEFSRRATESLAALATASVAATELMAAKMNLNSDYAARPIEQHLRDIEAYALPRNYPLTVAEKIEKITAADVQRVAKRLLDANALTVVVLGQINENFKANL
jgi:zinc protease